MTAIIVFVTEPAPQYDIVRENIDRTLLDRVIMENLIRLDLKQACSLCERHFLEEKTGGGDKSKSQQHHLDSVIVRNQGPFSRQVLEQITVHNRRPNI